MNKTEPSSQRKLRQAIDEAFNLSEVKTLCFDLEIDFDKLPPGNKEDKIRELVALCLRNQRINELISLCESARPKTNWRAMMETAVSDTDPPFMGLKYFDADHADLFFGRETLTAELTAHLQNNNFLAVVGASGSGKSSLVRAGLVPTLQEAQPKLKIHIFTPTDQPLEALATTLTRHTDSIGVTAKFIDAMVSDSRSLHLAARRLVQDDEQLLLVIDQFEELFTLCRSEKKRQAFIDNLVTAVSPENNQSSHHPTRAVIALRADFYHHCAQYDALRTLLEKQQRFIGAMSPTELRRAIEMPASQNNLTLEDGLVDLLLRDVGASGEQRPEPGALPLLSHALLETWRRREGNKLTFSGYTDAGGVQGAIAKTAESVFSQKLTSTQQTIARSIFLRLTELGEGTQDTRRRALISELLPASDTADETQTVLNLLSAARLVTTDEETAEVAHEALIREWPTLRRWLDENRDGLRLHRHLTESAQAWQQLNQDSGELYRGARLEQTQEWAAQHDKELNDLEREFLAASIKLKQKQTRQSQLIRTAILAFLLLVLASLTIAIIIFNNQSRENRDLIVGLATQAAIAETAKSQADMNAQSAQFSEATAVEALERSIAANEEIDNLIFLNEVLAETLEADSSQGNQELRATATALAIAAQNVDSDGDGLSELQESELGTNPNNPDSDADDLIDGDELAAGTDPLNPDTDDDGHLDSSDEDPIRPFITATNFSGADLVKIITLIGEAEETFTPQSIAISPANSGSRFIAAGRYDISELTPTATVYLWELGNGKLALPPLETDVFGEIHAIGFTLDTMELRVVAGSSIMAWSLNSGERIWNQGFLSAFGLSEMCSASFSPDSSRVLFGGQAVWRYFSVSDNGRDFLQIAGDSQNYNTNACYSDAIFSYDSTYFGLIEDEGPDESVFLGQEINLSFTRPFNKSVSGTIDMALSPDNNILALGFENGRVELYDYSERSGGPPLIYGLDAHPSMTHAIFSPDGTILATSSPEDSIVRLWRAEDGEPLLELDAETEGVTSLIFSQDGHYLLFGTTEGEVHVYGMPEVER